MEEVTKENYDEDFSVKEEKCLYELKRRIKESDDDLLKILYDKDDYLRTFIIGRKYNVNSAYDTARANIHARNGQFKKIYLMEANSFRHVIEGGFLGVLKNRDKLGRLIAFMRIPKLDIKTMAFEDILRTAIFIVDSHWYDRQTIKNGQVFIVDYSGYNLSIFTKYTLPQKLQFCSLFLNNYPTKFKEAHIYNNPKLVTYSFSLIKPFLPDKLRKRIFLHGANQKAITEHFSADILPKWMGGNLDDKDAIQTDLFDKLCQPAAELLIPGNPSASSISNSRSV